MRDQDVTPVTERWAGEYEGNDYDEIREPGKSRSKDKSRKEEKDHRSKDSERPKTIEDLKVREKELSSKNRRKEDRDEREKHRDKDGDREKHREKERDKEKKDRGKEREREREKELEKDGDRGRDKERGNDIREKDKGREKERDKAKDKEREKHKDREREKEIGRDRGKDGVERDKVKERNREKDKLNDKEKDRTRDRDRTSHRQKGESHVRVQDVGKDVAPRLAGDDARDNESIKEGVGDSDGEDDTKIPTHPQDADTGTVVSESSQSSNLEERIAKMREERLKKSSEGASEILSWVNRSRKVEDKKIAEKEKAMQLSRIFEEQDNMNDEETDDEITAQHPTKDLAGVKILDGLDKVLEGGAVVLTLKDQGILVDGDINQETDILENVEIGEQKRRDAAYKAAKKNTGVYDDKFNNDSVGEKKILPQYDDPVADEGVTLDSSGHFTVDAERKLEELRKRIQGVSASSLGEDLNSTGKIATDYYTQEEMMKFKKPKKKKALRKKEKLDIDALEADAISTGLGTGDLGSRNDRRRQNLRREQDKTESEMRTNAYQIAYAKADEATKALRQEQMHTVYTEEDDTPVFGDDDEELRKSLERARKIALKKQDKEEKSVPLAITLLATGIAKDSTPDNPNLGSGEHQENKVVFTEMEEFVWGLQLDEEAQKPDNEDVFMEEDIVPKNADQEMKDEDGGWAELKETMKDEIPAKEEEMVVPDATIHESAVGKGLAGALKLLKDRGTLKETIEWGGRNMDKKKSKLVGICDNDGAKEILIERTDEYGRILTPKESFRLLSHKFHGKGPGKMKQEKRMRQYHEELKIKQMKNAETPSLSVERMRDAQAKLQTPYLVLSGHVKPGQSNDPRSDFTAVEKDLAGGLTPMLGNKKVEHFLNIKRKFEHGDIAAEKKPKTKE